jgi:hypothetical protein
MNAAAVDPIQVIDWSVASRVAPTEIEAGDLHLVSQWEGGALVAVIDGLGHGPERFAAWQAAEVLESRACEPLVAWVNHSHEAILLRSGVVAYQLPALHPVMVPMAVGDEVGFATDGGREDFSERVTPGETLTMLVERIPEQSFRGTDDGLVLAGKYTGAR